MFEENNYGGDALPMGGRGDSLVNASDATDQGDLVVSVIRDEKPVGKGYDLLDGKVLGSRSSSSSKAVGETISFSSFEDFTSWRKALPSECMLVSGTFEALGQVAVVYKGNEILGEVSRSKKYLAHRHRPGILIIDIDYKNDDEVVVLYLGGEQPYTLVNGGVNLGQITA